MIAGTNTAPDLFPFTGQGDGSFLRAVFAMCLPGHGVIPEAGR